MTEDRIMTLHPEGKQGVNIKKPLYDAMRRAILRVVPKRATGISFKELPQAVEPFLGKAFEGTASVMWYCVAVKQDLEARGLIERVPKVSPQHLRKPKEPKP